MSSRKLSTIEEVSEKSTVEPQIKQQKNTLQQNPIKTGLDRVRKINHEDAIMKIKKNGAKNAKQKVKTANDLRQDEILKQVEEGKLTSEQLKKELSPIKWRKLKEQIELYENYYKTKTQIVHLKGKQELCSKPDGWHDDSALVIPRNQNMVREI